ncbi:uncharacterized protein PSFLO_00609 [Pseudozyma flocculosa]|uniref:Uncharacterized protein n=2 Tax=Pseudozyma flocculosa TaxID=84751 RepID=A0A5C3ESC0_9BASI|nr:uncharacterized protein PSFLO_00609 [Pseudozyma flocculosa]
MARGVPFSFDSLDMTLPLAKLSNRLHSSVERLSHFELRLDYHLPVLLSPDCSEERRIAAAYLCHQPYRVVIAKPACQPFREVLVTLLPFTTTRSSPALRHALEILLYGSDRELESLSSESPQQLVQDQSSGAGPSSGISSRIAELVKKATVQTLSMGEQRMLASILGSAQADAADAAFAARLPPVWLAKLIEPEHLVQTGANSPMITCEMVGRLCQEAINADSEKGHRFGPVSVQRYLTALQNLPPTLRSFDLVTRLLRSERPAPAPSQPKSQPVCLKTTVAHLARLLVLGGFLSNSVRHLERRESDEEAEILSEAHDGGLPEPSRREVEEELEERMSREVSIFCHFIRSLINAALLYTPDLGVLRRQISGHRGQLDEDGIKAVEEELKEMESEVESNTQAMLVELQHFALHFGRYRDGTRLYGELTSLH